jgi:hypothetical protein
MHGAESMCAVGRCARVVATLVASIMLACNFPKAADPDTQPEQETEWGHDDRIQGPDGEAVPIKCSSMTDCYEKAGERCPSGYEVVDREKHDGTVTSGTQSGTMSSTTNGSAVRSGNTTYGSAASTGSYAGSSTQVSVPILNGEMLVKCKGGALGTAARLSQRADEIAKERQEQKAAVCRRAFDHVADLANQWAEANAAREPADTLPARDRFLAVCGELAPEAQACLDAPYARAHADDCRTTLRALPRGSLHRVEAMFLKAPSK